MASELNPCPFCRKPMMLREALWPSEGDTDAIIHADKTDCPMFGFGDGSADGSIVEKWNICSSHDEDDFPSDGSCVRCGSVPRNANGLCNTCLDEDAERLENTRPAPTATDTGLKTIGFVPPMFVEGKGEGYSDIFRSVRISENHVAVVTRSQAEDIIRDLETKILEAAISDRLDDAGSPLSWQERAEIAEGIISDLKADNAAKDARIKELEEEVEWAQNAVLARQRHAEARCETLEAKLAAAEKALEPFADIADLIDAETEGMAETDELILLFQDYEFAKWPVSIFRKARAVLGGKLS